jgi:predicted DNA-binding protein
MTTVRLPIQIEQKLETLAKAKHKSKSELIKEALEAFFQQEEAEKDSFEIGQDSFGRYGSGDGSLSVTYKLKIKEKLNAKYNTH